MRVALSLRNLRVLGVASGINSYKKYSFLCMLNKG
jgi:hypothetical protein